LNSATQTKYYCWIPILTHELRPQDCQCQPIKPIEKILSDTDPSQKAIANNFKWDERGFVSGFLVSAPEKYFIQATCKIQKSGLASFSFNFDPKIKPEEYEIIKKGIAIYVFDNIRDIYHDHVHHDKIDDATLLPVEAVDDHDAINKILNQNI